MPSIIGINATFPLGSRKSKLALIQTNLVLKQLKELYPEYNFPILSRDTVGDEIINKALFEFKTQMAKSLWTRELEVLLMHGECRMLVHSLKDLPTDLPEGMTIACITRRSCPLDAVVMRAGSPYKSVSELPPNSVVGTSSIRRRAMLQRHFPHLKFRDIRGNVGTRLAKLDAPDSPFDCLILAAAGLIRLNLKDRITQMLQAPFVFYAVGQGALAVEVRADDTEIIELLKPLQDMETTYSCLAERALMKRLQGGCAIPIGVETQCLPLSKDKYSVVLQGMVVSSDGTRSAYASEFMEVSSEKDAEQLGMNVATALLKRGAGAILEEHHRSESDSN
ncbi:hydroxymethylbilane synthase [Schizosaccharomyces japonicus yFS275]|uniref:Porphobilinogen deaminase n=1 Tax=Schizosaccharomyces japonicus (strain yFS275 / FY16936) TaxID=402676 RepID=B6K1G7_SCHJY|nr:hydroxymethylbilane synthase [Schizosaccharomyces japonicus yFS275]EEB07788.1 hydroxymethylbilane synthase [Schizosaccharomyces japonicus yFS275]